MTVIGSVEFEVSLSLKKFNQDINNLISKNKGLVVPVNAVLNFDAKNQISKVSKTGLPVLKIKVDDVELTKLNKHLELKRTHHKSVQQYFNSNPLAVKTDNREIEKSIQKVKELRNEVGLLKQNLGGVGGSKITIEYKFPTQPGGDSGGAVVAASVSRSISSVSTAINRSSSFIQSTFLAGSSVVQSRISMNTVVLSSNIKKTNSILESVAKSLPDSIGKSVKRYSKDGLIMSLIKAPFKMAGGAVGGAVRDVSRGYFENIGQNVSAGFGTGKAAKDASKKVKHYMDLTDEYLIGGVDNFMAAFLAELTRSGSIDKATKAAIPRLRLMKEYAPQFEKMMQLSGILDSIRAGIPVPEDIKELLLKGKLVTTKKNKKTGEEEKVELPLFRSKSALEHAIELIKDGKEGSQNASTKIAAALFDPGTGALERFNPQDLIQGYINPVLKEISAITGFIGKIQQNRAIIKAQDKMAEVRALLPKLEEGQKGYLQVIGGAVQKQGKGGGYKLESYLEPLARERKVLPVHNPDTDPAGIEDRDPFLASVLEIMKGIAPEIFANKELYNTLLNGITMGTQTVNPMFQSQAVTDALANILVALENGVAPEDISTVSYSLGGKEARALADALHILGIEVKTVALAYPEINASQTDVPNFVATQIIEDGLGFVKNVLRLGGQQNMQVYKGGVIPGPEAHAPKHYFKNEQQVADFFADLGIDIPDVSSLSAFSDYITMVENFTEQISNYYQAISLATTGELDPTKSIEGTGQKGEDAITGVLEATYKKQSFKAEGAPGIGATPEMQAVAKKMIELQNRAYDALEKRLVALGLKQPVGETREARAGELFGQIKLRSEFENGLKPFLDSLESGVIQKNRHGDDSYYAADFDPQKVMMRSVDAANAARYFKNEGALEDEDYTEAIVTLFENIRKIATEFYKSQGKITPDIKNLIDEARNSPLLDTVSTPAGEEYYEMFGKNIEGDDTISRKDQREFTIPVPKWLKKSPSSAIAYNQLLADVGSQGYIPPIHELEAVGYGMSGAASFIGKDHVYKNEPGNPQAVASKREIEAYKKLAGRYSPLMYAAEPGKALVVERVKGKSVKDILNNLAEPAKESQEKISKLTEELGKTTGESERKTLIEQIAKETQNLKKYKIAFNAEAVKIYEQIGRLGKTMIELGVAHGDLASANVFRLDDGSYTSIDLGNAVVNPTKADRFNDKATTMQRAVIDRDFWGILDPMKVVAAISKGYSGESLPEQEKRFGSVDDLPKYNQQPIQPIPLGSEQKGLMEEYLNYKEEADAIRAGESGEILMSRAEFRKLMAGKLIPETKPPEIDESSPGWEQGSEQKAEQKAEKQYKKPEQSYHKFPTPDEAIIKKVQGNLPTAQKDLKEEVKLSPKEIDSIAHDLKTYFRSETLKKTLKSLGQKPTGKNAEDYARQLSQVAGMDAISIAYKQGGRQGLMARGKSKESSLNKERLLEENGYKILKALYAKLNKQLKEKEKELKTSVSSIATATGEQELAKGIGNVSNKASEIYDIVGGIVDELEAVKAQYNVPQSIGQSLSGMLSAIKDYENKTKLATIGVLSRSGDLSSFKLPQLALPELKIPERELNPVELPNELRGANPNQQMMGLGIAATGASFFGLQGGANAATGAGLGALVPIAPIAPIAIPIAFTLAAGGGAIAVSKAIQPFLQKNAPNIASILYLNIGSAITGFAGKIKSAFNRKASSQATKIQSSNTPPLPPLVMPPSNPWQFVQGKPLPLPSPTSSSIAAAISKNVSSFFYGIFQRISANPSPPPVIQPPSPPTVIQPPSPPSPPPVIQPPSPPPVIQPPRPPLVIQPPSPPPVIQPPSPPLVIQPPSPPTVIQPPSPPSPPPVIQPPSPPTVIQQQQSGMPAVFNPGATRAAANSINQSVSSVSSNYSTLAGIIRELNSFIPAPLKPLVEQIKRLGKTFLFGQVFGFFQNQLQNIASQTFEVTKRFQVLENTINFLSGGTRAGAEQMRFLRSEINRTSSAIEPALQSYKKLAASTRNTPMEGMVTNNLTSALMQAGTVFGLTGEELEGSILAISQIAGKGVVSLEELRGQLAERIPGAMQIAARSMNMTEQELYKLISTGTLSATDFLTKFGPQLMAETSAGVASASNTAQAALTRLNNSITEIQVAAGKEFQGPLVLGMNAITFAIQLVTKYAGTFIQMLQVAAGVALAYAAPAMWAFVQGLWQVPLASVAASMAVNGLKDTIMTLIVPTAAAFVANVAAIWLVIEALKTLGTVWDVFFSKTDTQTWSESVYKNLQKARQDIKYLWKEIEKSNKNNLPKKQGGKYETEFSYLDKEQRDKLSAMNFLERFSYSFGGESMEDQIKIQDALKQTIKDQRDIKQLQRDRVSGAMKELNNFIDSAITQDNINAIKEYNAQLENLRQKASITTNPEDQRKIKEQVEQLRKLRDGSTAPLVTGLGEVNSAIENRQKRIKDTNSDEKREELRLDLIELQKLKDKLEDIERQTGAQTTLSELMQVLARIRIEMEMFNRVAQEVADKGLRRIAEIELKGLRTDIFASADAALKRSENALELVRNKINISANAIKELKALLKDPMIEQYTKFYGDKSLEQLRVDLEGVDEKDVERRKTLEALILLREQESGLIALQREQAESVLNLEKERSQAVLNRLERYKAKAQNKGQIEEAGLLTAITRGQLKWEIGPEKVDLLKTGISLAVIQRNQKIAEIELQTVKKYFKEKKITAEDFANRRMELELQVAQFIQQVAEQELQLRQQKQQLLLDQLDRATNKIKHQIKLGELAGQINQKTSQIRREIIVDTRTRFGEDTQTEINRQTEDETLAGQRESSILYKAELQRNLALLQSHYSNREISQRDYEDKSREIEQEIASTNIQLKDYELQEHQRFNQRIVDDRMKSYQRMVEDFERTVKTQENTLQLSAIRQEQIIRQQQLRQIDLIGSQKAEQQAAITLNQFQIEQTKKQLKDTLQQIQDVAQLRKKNALTERETEERTIDLTIKAEQLKLDLINKQIEKNRQLKDLRILALDDESSRIDILFQKHEMMYSYGLEKRKQIVESLDREKTIIEAQIRLQQSLFKGEEQRRQAALDRSRNAEDLLGRLSDLQKRAMDNSIGFNEYRGIRYLMDLLRQIAGAQSGSAFLSETDIRDLITKQYNQSVIEEKNLLEMKTRQLEQQQKIQTAQHQLQKAMNRLTAENAIMEASISLNKARQAELQAKIALEKANINGDPREIQNAQNAYDLTKQGTQLSQQQLGIAVERLTVSNQIAGIDEQALVSDQGNERFALQESNRKALQDTAIRGGELASQGAINPDQIIKVDMSSIKFDLSPITPMVDLTSQISTKLDGILTAIKGVINKPTPPTVENLTVVSSDPTGDSRQVLGEMTKARNMY